MGIPPEHVTSLFVPYSQADASIASKFGGTGLGLSICQQLVTLMSGKISVQSEVGKGTCFTCTLPTKLLQKESFTPKVHIDSRPILLIHGENTAASSALHALVAQGYQIHAVASIKSALQRSRNRSFAPSLTAADGTTQMTSRWQCAVLAYELIQNSNEEEMLALSELLEHRLVATVPCDKLTEIDRLIRLGVQEVVARPYVPSEIVGAIDRIVQPTPALPAPEPIQHIIPIETETSTQRPLKILVSDDTHVNRVVVKLLLEHEGHTVETVDSGKATLELLENQGDFDLLLLDLNLPDMAGTEVSERIRHGNGPSKAIPIVAITAHTSIEKRNSCFTAGMNECLHKPIKIHELARIVTQVTSPASKSEWADRIQEEAPPCEIATSVDLQNLLSRYGEDWEMIAEIAEAFLEEKEMLLKALSLGAGSRDRDKIASAAHAIRSSAGNVSAGSLWYSATKVELASQTEELDVLVHWCNQIHQTWDTSAEELRRIVERYAK